IDSTSEEVIYKASHVISYDTVLRIIHALKDTIVVELISGFNNAAYTAKIAKIRESYKNKQDLLDKLEALFELYYNVTKDSSTGPPKCNVTMNEAENTLAELLA
ncbi:19271_t:CDS:2, partial [Rhizophagus irregularis]